MLILIEDWKFSSEAFEGLYRIAVVRCCKDLLLGRGFEALSPSVPSG
jgi:hypothetical protein